MIKKINYKPEIDFLRAIAVTSVIIYHANINFLGYKILPGGYLGVDIFFVISGYLISAIILNKIEDKNFSFKDFYLRRARRILPALLVMIILIFPIAWLILLPSSLIDFSNSIIFSLGFSSNYYFYFTGLEYGAKSGLLKPLLHTWSLGVEEQFYLIFPLILIGGIFLFKKKIVYFLVFLFFSSIIFANYYFYLNSDLNFYILFSRIWELLFGTLILFFEKNRNFKVSKNESNFLCLLGLFLIFLSLTYFYESVPSPNYKNLLPIIGASIIILYMRKDTIIYKLFSLKIFLSIGLISYSLYLWHYPIFAFARNIRIEQSYLSLIIISLLTFLLSFLSYFFIEKPFRSEKFISNKKFLKILLITIIGLILISFITIKEKGFKSRFTNYDKFSVDYGKYLKEVRLKKYELSNPKFENKNKKNVLIIGNSHGRGMFNSLKFNENLFTNHEFSILDTQVRCIKFIIEKNQLCSEKKLSFLEKKIFQEADIISIATNFGKQDIEILKDIVIELKKINKEIILVSQKPYFYFENYLSTIDKFFINKKRLPNKDEIVELEKEYFDSHYTKIETEDGEWINVNKILKEISISEDVKLLIHKKILCNEVKKRCKFLTDDNRKIYYDASHYTLEGAKFAGKKMFELKWFD